MKWWDKSWNTLIGCSHASSGCSNCYGERLAATRLRHLPTYGLVVQSDKPRWNGKVLDLTDRLGDPLRWRKPQRIFVNDMGDTFHPEVSFTYITAMFGVMAACPQHTFMLLTKRPERMLEFYRWVEKREMEGRSMFCDDSPEWRIWQMLHVSARRKGVKVPSHHGGGWPLPNVWVGTTCEDQTRAEERIPFLIQVPAVVRFLSLEPLLGDINIGLMGTQPSTWMNGQQYRMVHQDIHWAITGGESGPRARQCAREWLVNIVRQCHEAGTPCFVKQLGSAYVDEKNAIGGRYVKVPEEYGSPVKRLKDMAGRDMAEWPSSLRVRQYPEATCAT